MIAFSARARAGAAPGRVLLACLPLGPRRDWAEAPPRRPGHSRRAGVRFRPIPDISRLCPLSTHCGHWKRCLISYADGHRIFLMSLWRIFPLVAQADQQRRGPPPEHD